MKKNIETCKQFIELVHDIGGKGVKVRPNGVPKGADPQKTFEQIGKALIECGKAARDAGRRNLGRGARGRHGRAEEHPAPSWTPAGIPSVGLTWNSNATDLDAKKSVEPAFELLKPWIRSCHINDLENDKKGTYPYRELFALFRAMDYDRYTLCEVGKSYDVAEGTKFLKVYKKQWDELVG